MQEIALVEALQGGEVLPGHGKARAGDGGNGNPAAGGGIAFVMDLEPPQETEPVGQTEQAEQRGDRRHLPAPGPALLGQVRVQHPGPHETRGRAHADTVGQGLETARLQEGIGIEKHHHTAVGRVGSHIGGPGKAHIALATDQDDPVIGGHGGIDPALFLRAGSIVDNDELVRQGIGPDAINAALQRRSRPEHDHHHRDAIAIPAGHQVLTQNPLTEITCRGIHADLTPTSDPAEPHPAPK